jgi:transaldolase/glucose-6-phosphate isomerase
MITNLGVYQSAVDDALAEMKRDQIMRRIWEHDHTVWNPDPREISNRLGWLHMPEEMPAHTGQLRALAESARADGYTHVLLLGMGGSSLAPELFAHTFTGSGTGIAPSLQLAVLDSTDPDRVRQYAETLDPSRTLYIVATKSGGTVETLSFFKYFYNQTAGVVGPAAAGDHFVAITDPGSKLVDLADRYHFRHTFLNDPNIGGRYSALSYFGLVPAVLVDVDVDLLLQRAQEAAGNARGQDEDHNHSAQLGAIMGELALAGRDKVTFITSSAFVAFGDWVEQLIAESTGKDGKGILPVVGEPLGNPEDYGADRLFVHLRLDGDSSADEGLAALSAAGHPLLTIRLRDRYDLGGQFLLWEMATAVAGYRLGIQPFDQPNVESAKVLARQMVAEYTSKGELPPATSSPVSAETLHRFLAQAGAGDYVSFQAYVPPTKGTDVALQALRTQVRDRYRLATTVGYGPRFLHSTGQLHKGDRGNGLFIQFTSDTTHDVAIPDEAGQAGSSMSFGVLKMAQALGDGQALRDNRRRVIRFHLGTDVISQLQALIDS